MIAVNRIKRVPPDDDRAAAQAVLPTRLGGLGIMRKLLGDGYCDIACQLAISERSWVKRAFPPNCSYEQKKTQLTHQLPVLCVDSLNL